MKRFKQYIKEKETTFAGKKRETMNIIRTVLNKAIPVNSTTMKIINQKKPKPPFWHITSIKGLKYLFKMEGSKKSISVSLRQPNEHMVKIGVTEFCGLLVELDGLPYLTSDLDIYS